MKLLSLSFLALLATGVVAGGKGPQCRCYPGDSCWPSKKEWDKLSKDTNGKLGVELPPGLACFPTYEGQPVDGANDPAKCQEVTDNWANPDYIANLGTWPMVPFYGNSSCYPSNADTCTATCDQGIVPTYVIKATKVSHIQAGVKFARKHNLRLIVRNTGHDFMGRSVGWGALVINTFRLKDTKIINKWNGPDGYRGRAVKAGAGVMVRELYETVWAADQDVLAGECPTVGVAGGYVQGGGQGPLSGVYGLASDNALEFEAVLANGNHVTANSKKNSDLFWALKGGGPGTYAVVTSVTFKTFDRIPVSGVTLNIMGEGEAFYEGLRIWYTFGPELVQHGVYVWYLATPGFINAQPILGPDMTAAQLDALLQPMFDQFDAAGVTYVRGPALEFPNFESLYDEMWETSHHASGLQSAWGGRLVALQDVVENGDGVVGAIREVWDEFGAAVAFGGHLVNAGNGVQDPGQKLSAVHPVWRNTADVMVYLYFAEDCVTAERRQEILDTITYGVGDIIRRETPNSAVYSNEGDINEPNWQNAFWGPVYPKLVKIKEKYDKDRVFWTKATPGSEAWELVDERLCKA